MTERTGIQPDHTAVIAIDFQHDIVGEGGAFASMFHAEVQRTGMIVAASTVLQSARALGMKIVYSCGAFQPGYPELVSNIPVLTMVAQHNCLIEGTDGAAIIAEMK